MSIKDLIKKELEEQRKGLSIKDPRSAKPPQEKEMEDEEDTDIPSPKFKKFGKLSKKEAEKGWGSGPKEQKVRETIRQEIQKTLEEHGELDEGFLDRLKANVAGAMGSAGAKISRARSKVGSAIAGSDSDVAYTGPDPDLKAKGARLVNRTKTMLKKFDKLAVDFNKDAESLGLDVDALTPLATSMDALRAALKTTIATGNKMTQGKDLNSAETLKLGMLASGDNEVLQRIFRLAAQQAQQIEKEKAEAEKKQDATDDTNTNEVSDEIESGDSYLYTSQKGKRSFVTVTDSENSQGAVVVQRTKADCSPIPGQQFAVNADTLKRSVKKDEEGNLIKTPCSNKSKKQTGTEPRDRETLDQVSGPMNEKIVKKITQMIFETFYETP